MLKKILSICCMMVISSVTFAAVSSKPPTVFTDEKPNLVITKNQSTFIIRLKSNPTTGFSWFLREYDSNLLVPIKHQFVKQTATLMGAPGVEEWTFKMKPLAFTVPHQTTIRFAYARPWESGDSSTQVVFRISTQ